MQYTRVEISLDYTYTIIHFIDAQRICIRFVVLGAPCDLNPDNYRECESERQASTYLSEVQFTIICNKT